MSMMQMNMNWVSSVAEPQKSIQKPLYFPVSVITDLVLSAPNCLALLINLYASSRFSLIFHKYHKFLPLLQPHISSLLPHL